ncbi:hypothetical protein MARBORIA2_15950 [Methanobrevibacter arboriphilus]|uniref:Uncharacterized protein n=1 Tax=Methanobrevibacter arboriphilus TaxID=39441 RepID=A0ACA8R2S8_METAZ|nr:hypothetical protein MarbSA_06630 [Methanobrevibacter arboriphilus]GLI12505.1 hypothetical protein MARBORIA2_15950 [Methanobrevibacter arboriphilus]
MIIKNYNKIYKIFIVLSTNNNILPVNIITNKYFTNNFHLYNNIIIINSNF